jgi:cation diffusion facilitator family transporter
MLAPEPEASHGRDVTDTFALQRRLINLSLAVAIVLLVVKVAASILTGSSAIYSDAVESVVHLVAVIFASWALRIAQKPADATHHFGHDKVQYLSSGFEGAMIAMAAVLILYEAAKQFVFGVEIERVTLGIILTAAVASVNLALGLALLKVGKASNSPLLRANGLHVLADVWTSVAVLIALLLIHWTGWLWWDPIAAIIAALNILYTGVRLIRQSLAGLLDEADPVKERELMDVLEKVTTAHRAGYHNFRHRHSGHVDWVELHLVFEDRLSVVEAHTAATAIEAAIAEYLGPQARVITHLEPKSAEGSSETWEIW